MANYIYTALIYHNTTDVIVSDPSQQAINTTDFETNYKSSAVKVDDFTVVETSFVINKTYTEFKALIDGIEWSDVKYVEDGKAYCLYILTANPL